MAKRMDWDRVQREDRVTQHGSERIITTGELRFSTKPNPPKRRRKPRSKTNYDSLRSLVDQSYLRIQNKTAKNRRRLNPNIAILDDLDRLLGRTPGRWFDLDDVAQALSEIRQAKVRPHSLARTVRSS